VFDLKKETLRPNLWKELPTLDSDIIELLTRKTIFFTGSNKNIYKSLNGLMNFERNSSIIEEHLRNEAIIAPQTDKMAEWLNATANYFARETEENPIFKIPEEDWNEQIPEPIYTRLANNT
jgi:hypothetical protein